MNRIRKLISLLLVVLMLIPTTVFAADSDRDMFCCRTEIVEIDNTSYTVNYEYDKSGTKTIEMVDNVTGNVDEFVYVENTGKMYLNGELIATVYKKNTATHGLAGAGNVNVDSRASGDTGWVCIESDSFVVTWQRKVGARFVAMAIGSLFGFPVSMIVSAVGNAFLKRLSDDYDRATISYDLYDRLINNQGYMKYIWEIFTVDGGFGGPYETIIAYE